MRSACCRRVGRVQRACRRALIANGGEARTSDFLLFCYPRVRRPVERWRLTVIWRAARRWADPVRCGKHWVWRLREAFADTASATSD